MCWFCCCGSFTVIVVVVILKLIYCSVGIVVVAELVELFRIELYQNTLRSNSDSQTNSGLNSCAV